MHLKDFFFFFLVIDLLVCRFIPLSIIVTSVNKQIAPELSKACKVCALCHLIFFFFFLQLHNLAL